MTNNYINRVNATLFLCDECEEIDGELININGIKNKILIDESKMTDIKLLCRVDLVEYVLRNSCKDLSFVFFIRTINQTPAYINRLSGCKVSLSSEVDDVITYSFPIITDYDNLPFPSEGKYAIEVYLFNGDIDVEKEKIDKKYYRRKENFINMLMIEVEKQ
ncbi:MAG: hypothetical protein PHW34_13415 [Hespellia sp.]|nr:hypothetical protein [Hespellia sp.]